MEEFKEQTDGIGFLPVQLIRGEFGAMALIQFPGRGQPRVGAFETPRSTSFQQERIMTIQSVRVLSEGESNGKPRFSVLLETDLESEPSNRQRRTVEILSLYLGVEEKEIPVWTRLAGREIGLLLERSESSLKLEDLAAENRELQSEVDRLRKKNQGLAENFQTLIESTREVS